MSVTSSKRMLVPQCDRQVILSACAVVHRARLDAMRELEDLSSLPAAARSDALVYWQDEAHRLEAAHAWLVEILTS
jgi:hypothetical protein